MLQCRKPRRSVPDSLTRQHSRFGPRLLAPVGRGYEDATGLARRASEYLAREQRDSVVTQQADDNRVFWPPRAALARDLDKACVPNKRTAEAASVFEPHVGAILDTCFLTECGVLRLPENFKDLSVPCPGLLLRAIAASVGLMNAKAIVRVLPGEATKRQQFGLVRRLMFRRKLADWNGANAASIG